MAKKKKRRPAPPPKQAARKKPPRKKTAPVPKHKKQGAGVMVESQLAAWWKRLGVDEYTGREWGRLGLLATGLLVILFYAFSAGGYFVPRRSYGELFLLWILVVGLLFDLQVKDRLPRLGAIELALFGGYVAWLLLSIIWSVVPARSLDEFVRGMLYLTGFGLFYIYLAKKEWLGWLGHLFVAIVLVVAIDSLIGKTFPNVLTHPDPFATNRINYPITYWNAMAMFVTMGFVVGLRVLADRATGLAVRCFYAPTLLLFLVVLWFTSSRAGILLLGAGICLYLYLSVCRLRVVLQTAMLMAWTGLVVAFSFAFLPDMVTSVPDPNLQAGEGHQLAAVIIVMMAVAVASQIILRSQEGRVTVTADTGRRIGYGIAGGLALMLVTVSLVFTFTGGRGGPVSFVRNQLSGLNESERTEVVEKPSERLFSLKSERFQEYGVSLKRFGESPMLGSGAGTWSVAWLKYRPWDIQVKDGHSWFFETMAELGLVGTLLLVGFIAVFFMNSVKDLKFLGKGRDRELYGAFFTVCAMFLAHAMIDWDWEMPVISLAFFMFAGGLLRFGQLAREQGREEAEAAVTVSAGGWRRFTGWNWLVGGLCIFAMAITIVPLLAYTRVQAAGRLAQQKDYAALEREAKTAATLGPLDAEPLMLQALAVQEQGDLDQAQSLLREALDKEPQNDRIYRNLTRVYLQQYEMAKRSGDTAAMQMYLNEAVDAIVMSRHLNPLESQETGNLENQVRNIGGTVPPPPEPGG